MTLKFGSICYLLNLQCTFLKTICWLNHKSMLSYQATSLICLVFLDNPTCSNILCYSICLYPTWPLLCVFCWDANHPWLTGRYESYHHKGPIGLGFALLYMVQRACFSIMATFSSSNARNFFLFIAEAGRCFFSSLILNHHPIPTSPMAIEIMRRKKYCVRFLSWSPYICGMMSQARCPIPTKLTYKACP